MVFYYHKCPPLSKLNEMINTVLHCVSTECPMILVVKCQTDIKTGQNCCQTVHQLLVINKHTYEIVEQGEFLLILITFHLTPWHQMTTIVITLCDAQKTKEKLKSSTRMCQIWHVLA